MPYYCTVPRCTSMAGKAKNVSFHQFPRDEELAQLWNNILKRGKPYTKYSKVCSLHFRPEDYTITSVGKNKGQWRTLRKDAIPSRNLPSESPPSQRRSRTWMPHQAPSSPSSVVDPQIQQNIAQLIYLQTMLAMQANNSETQPNLNIPHGSIIQSEVERRLQKHHNNEDPNLNNGPEMTDHQNYHHNDSDEESITKSSYKCEECSKCFKDPDVYKLHQRTHKKSNSTFEKENLNSNISKHINEKMLKANPILTNLLNNDMQKLPDSLNSNFDDKNIETHIMQAFAANMESYINNFKSVMMNQNRGDSDNESNVSDENIGEDSWENQNHDSATLVEEKKNSNEVKSNLIVNDFNVDITIEEIKVKRGGSNENNTEVNGTSSEVSETVSEISENVHEKVPSDNSSVSNETITDTTERTSEITKTTEVSETVLEVHETVSEVNEKKTTKLDNTLLDNNISEMVSIENHVNSNSIDSPVKSNCDIKDLE